MTLKICKKLTILVLTLFLAIGLAELGNNRVNAQADDTTQTPTSNQNWSDTGLINTKNDDNIEVNNNVAGNGNSANVDFNGDGRSDYVITRNNNSLLNWWIAINGSTNFSSFQWGLATDIATPADFDGDGTSDFAVWRDEPTNPNRATFYIMRSATNTVQIEQFGRTGDNPRIVGDYDGDGRADVAVYREGVSGGQSFFFYRPSTMAGVDFVPRQFGTAGDKAVAGDYDGDRRADVAVVRTLSGGQNQFIYLRSSDLGDRYVEWGLSGDVIVPGDYDADGRTDFCVVRTVGGQLLWYILEADGGGTGTAAVNWGLSGDVLTPGDYDGDGRADIAVWRPSGTPDLNIFYVRRSTNNMLQAFKWGLQTDSPTANWRVIR